MSSKNFHHFTDQDVNIIIAVGHSGYEVDKKIAKEVEDVDLVVGGHSHSFLFSGKPPSNDKSKGEYPTLVTQSSGRVVPVVQAFWGTKYLGFIRLSFSENGELSSWNNTWRNSKTPILLDGSYKQGMLKIIDKLKIYSKKTFQ